MIITCTGDSALSTLPYDLDVRNESKLLLRLRGGGRGVSSLSVALHTIPCPNVISPKSKIKLHFVLHQKTIVDSVEYCLLWQLLVAKPVLFQHNQCTLVTT